MRWIGRYLHAEGDLVVDAELTLVAAHAIGADAEHELTVAASTLVRTTVHTDPACHLGAHRHN